MLDLCKSSDLSTIHISDDVRFFFLVDFQRLELNTTKKKMYFFVAFEVTAKAFLNM